MELSYKQRNKKSEKPTGPGNSVGKEKRVYMFNVERIVVIMQREVNNPERKKDREKCITTKRNKERNIQVKYIK